jgi:UDP-N-acetylmuramoyl-tripeptide--D-alanyl-D-alanine ligase
VARWAGGRLRGPDVEVLGVSTDTRSLAPGALFVALTGPRFDGHDFARAAREAGAAALMVSRPVPVDLPRIEVQDTLAALGRLAAAWRGTLPVRVVALTGSNGKTTVKELCASILGRLGPTWATRGNLNNHIGVPLTLLALDAEHRHAVVEMGANHPGEIAALTRLARPDVALVNNAGPAHLEGFGTVEGVARAKGEIFQGLGPGGVAVFNADDRHAAVWEALTEGRRRLRFGFGAAAEVRGRETPDGGLRIDTPLGGVDVRLRLAGRHNRYNALAATAAALALGAPLAAVVEGLERVRPVAGRLVPVPARRGAWLIDDTYNANPASLQAGIEALCAGPGEPWLILGDMAELGGEAQRLHEAAGRGAREAGVRRLFTLGRLARLAAESFGPQAEAFDEVEALIEAVAGAIRGGERILVKGSRAMRMERVVAALRVDRTGEGPQHAA